MNIIISGAEFQGRADRLSACVSRGLLAIARANWESDKYVYC